MVFLLVSDFAYSYIVLGLLLCVGLYCIGTVQGLRIIHCVGTEHENYTLCWAYYYSVGSIVLHIGAQHENNKYVVFSLMPRPF